MAKQSPITDPPTLIFCTKSLELGQNHRFQRRNVEMNLPLAQSPYLLELAQKGEPLPLDGDNLHLVRGLIGAEMITVQYMPSENAGTLVAQITPKGEEFLKWLAEP
jgi:hypothetical protein